MEREAEYKCKCPVFLGIGGGDDERVLRGQMPVA